MLNFHLNRKDFLLTLLSATLIVLAFPKFEITGLVFVGLIPLLFVLKNKTPKQAVWIGFILGFLISLGAFNWVLYTLQEFGKLPLILALPCFLIFAAFCNIHLALFSYLYVKFPMPKFQLFWVPILYTLVEFFSPQIFHWYLGSCLYKKLWLIQFAEVTGVFGITFLVVLLNVFIFELIRWIKMEIEVFPKYSFGVALLIFIVAGLYSIKKLDDYREILKTAPTIKAALVQTNVGNMDKFLSSQGYDQAASKMHEINKRLVLKASKTKDLDLIVLPETAVPGYFTPDRPKSQAIMFNLASEARTPIYFGGYHKEKDFNDKNQVFNSTFLISPHYQVMGKYDKMNLLIFGEYLPFSDMFPKLKEWVPSVGDFSKGKETTVIGLTKDRKLAPLICLEGLYANFVRKFVKLGANFIVIVTNDSWFGDTANPYQHMMLHVWRAIENRTPILRTANTGVSAFIDLSGKIQSQSSLFKEEILVDKVAIIQHRTFYTQYGNVFIYFLMLIAAIFFIANRSQKNIVYPNEASLI